MRLFVNNMADPDMNLTLTTYLGDNCIVFENFTASIGDMMVEFTVDSDAILNIKMYSCISLGLKITIPRNIVELLWHINNMTSYKDFQCKM